MNYWSAPAWTKQPHTDKYAKPISVCRVTNEPVIHIVNGFYRNAIFSGTFLLNDKNMPTLSTGKERVEVYCLWFGARLKTRGIKLLVDTSKGKATVDYKYTGDVVENLGI